MKTYFDKQENEFYVLVPDTVDYNYKNIVRIYGKTKEEAIENALELLIEDLKVLIKENSQFYLKLKKTANFLKDFT